ncbi:MAG: hypothetical protein RLY86_3509 [Pseudomonadota bacterium]|jgi:hypothetical protein
MQRMRRLLPLLPLLALALPQPALADLSREEALIILRTLSMVQPRPRTPVTVLVVDSEQAQAGTLAAVGVRVVAEAGLADAVGVLLPDGPAARTVAEQALAAGKVTIGLDRSCLEAELCVLYLSAAPETEIVIGRAALARAGVQFNQAFLFLAKQR